MADISLFLNDIRSPINIGQILRLVEVYRIPIEFYDPYKVIEKNYQTIFDFSTGAIKRVPHDILEREHKRFRTAHSGGRKIATYLSADATPLSKFKFEDDDLIYFGNENNGLDKKLVNACDERVIIDMPIERQPKFNSARPIINTPHRTRDKDTPSLNVTTSVAIVVYHALYGQEILR